MKPSCVRKVAPNQERTLPKLDALDCSLLQATALFCRPNFVKRLVKAGKSPRVLQYRLEQLRKKGLLDEMNELTEEGKSVVAGIEILREGGNLVESHSFWFKCRVLHVPAGLELKGWSRKQFRAWQEQLMRRDREVFLHVTGKTMRIHISSILGASPIENELCAKKIACDAVDVLQCEGWRLSEPISCKPSHHVIEPLKPIAEAIYRERKGISVLDVLVDNSNRDGGHFEVRGMDEAQALLEAIARLPELEKEIAARLSAVEKTAGLERLAGQSSLTLDRILDGLAG